MNSVRIAAVGPFGAAVATELTAALAPVRVLNRVPVSANTSGNTSTDGPIAAAQLRDAAVVVVVAGRPVPALTLRLEEVSFTIGVPWLPVLIESGVLRIGPLVVPGLSPCYRCFRGRLLQHASAPDVERALERHYLTHDDDEPGGFPSGTVGLTVDAVADVVDRARIAPTTVAGLVRQRDLNSGRMTTGRVVGIHGCDRCGLRRDERGRSSEELRRTIGEALGWKP